MSAKLVASAVVLLGYVVLSGCQTVTKIRCNTKNWYAVGERDGSAGKLPDATFQSYDEDCAASGASIDKSVYLAGHKEGLAQFCTLPGGIQQAADGFVNNNLCAADFGPEFDTGYAQGLEQLCGANGGRRLGEAVLEYRGTCSAQTEREFLNSYIITLESVALPTAQAEISTLSARSSSLQNTMTYLNTEIDKFDDSIKSAVKAGDSSRAKTLKRSRNNIESQRGDTRREKRKVDQSLSEARQRQQTAGKMISLWKPQLSN